MDNKFNKTKYICIISTLFSLVLMFFNYFTLSVPSLNELLSSDSFSISLMTLPFFVSENVIGLVSQFGGNSTALSVLILCALIKTASLFLVLVALLGLWRVFIKKEASRLLVKANYIILLLEFVSLVGIIFVNVIINTFSAQISSLLGSNFEISFMPTIWLFLSIAFSLISLHYSQKVDKFLR